MRIEMIYTKAAKIAKVGNEKAPEWSEARFCTGHLRALCVLGVNNQAVAVAAGTARRARLIIACIVEVGLAPFETQ
jgi:hypothetical protein